MHEGWKTGCDLIMTAKVKGHVICWEWRPCHQTPPGTYQPGWWEVQKALQNSTTCTVGLSNSKGTSIRQAPVFRHLEQSITEKPWKFIIQMNEVYTACCWFPTSSNILILPSSITVLTNQVWKLLIPLFNVPNTGAFTVPTCMQVIFAMEKSHVGDVCWPVSLCEKL